MSLNNMNRACSNMKNHAKEFVDVYFGNDVPYRRRSVCSGRSFLFPYRSGRILPMSDIGTVPGGSSVPTTAVCSVRTSGFLPLMRSAAASRSGNGGAREPDDRLRSHF